MLALLRLVVPPLCWLVLVIALATELGIRPDVIGSWAIDRFVDVPGAEQLHAQVLAFYYVGSPLPEASWSESERDHLADVRAVLDAIRMAGMVAAILLVAALFDRQQRWWGMRRGAAMLLALVVAVGLLASEWSLFSRGMHPVLVPQGNWDFLPG
ncbi:MAG: DUF1461 domain-containing protein, partial [Planctomycetota bacterium]